MDSPWLIASVTLAVFLITSIISRILVWVRDVDQWREVCAWRCDGERTGNPRVRLPGPGYRVLQRGKLFRAELLDPLGGVAKRFRTMDHMYSAVQECWNESSAQVAVPHGRGSSPTGKNETLTTFSIEKETLGSEPSVAGGSLRTA